MRSVKTAPEGWIQFLRSLACDNKLKVVVGHGVGAATDGETLWVPALPEKLTPDDLVLFKGNAFHEVGHIRKSNIKFFQAFSKEHGSFAQFLLNALDDVFMEGAMATWKKMASRYLLDSTMVLINRGQFRDGSASLGEAVACYCLSYLTAKRWPTVGAAEIRIEANLRKHLAEHADKVVPALRNLLDAEFPAVKSTEDGAALALKIIDLLKMLAEQEQSQPSPSADEDESQDDAEGSSASEQGQSDDADESESEPQGDDKGEGKTEESDPKGEGKGDGAADESSSDPKGEGQGESKAGDSKPEQNGDGSGNSEGGADDSESDPKGEGKGKGKAEHAGSESDSGDAGEGNGAQDDNGASQSGSGSEANSGKSLQQMVDEMLKEQLGNQEVFDKGSAIEELAKGISSGANEAYKGQPVIEGLVFDFATGAGKSEGFADGMPVVEADKVMANVIADVTGRKANVMGNRLRALLANREETDEYDARNGRLCERNLHRFALDDSRVFAKAEERVEDTAAVSITADLSGSTAMARDGSSVAEQIRIALTLIEKVLHEVGTPREILGFAPNSGQLNCMVKTFGDNHRVALDRIAGMHRLVGGGCTPIGDAVLQAGARLMGHEAQRKLLFVITDGLPDDVEHARDMTKTVLQGGVEVIYLVIGSAKACTWLQSANIKFAHAESAEGLIPALVSKVAEFLK